MDFTNQPVNNTRSLYKRVLETSSRHSEHLETRSTYRWVGTVKDADILISKPGRLEVLGELSRTLYLTYLGSRT